MDVGVALIPGGNNGLILAALPALSPGGTAASLLTTTTIVIRLSARATASRKGPSNKTPHNHSGGRCSRRWVCHSG